MTSKPPPIPLTLTEDEFENIVITYAKLRQWMVAHFRPAQVRPGKWVTPMKGDVGFPDLVLARDGVVLLRELKRHQGKVRPAQTKWLNAMGSNGGLWTPVTWNDGLIWEELA